MQSYFTSCGTAHVGVNSLLFLELEALVRVSLSGLLKNAAREPGYKYSLGELCEHLKMLRDDPGRHSEFFDLYVFGDDSEWRAKLAEAQATSTNKQSTPCICYNDVYNAQCPLHGAFRD